MRWITRHLWYSCTCMSTPHLVDDIELMGRICNSKIPAVMLMGKHYTRDKNWRKRYWTFGLNFKKPNRQHMSFHLLPLWSRMIMRLMIPYVYSRYNRDTRLMISLIWRIVSHWPKGDILGNHSISVIPVRCGMMGKLRSASYILRRVDAGLLIQLVILLKVRQWSSLPRLLITSMDAFHTNRPLTPLKA